MAKKNKAKDSKSMENVKFEVGQEMGISQSSSKSEKNKKNFKKS